jgi:hypothetical protein
MATAELDGCERWRLEQEKSGRADAALAIGARVRIWIDKPGEFVVREGVYEGFERKLLGANNHLVRFDGQQGKLERLQFRDGSVEWSVLRPSTLPGDSTKGDAQT